MIGVSGPWNGAIFDTRDASSHADRDVPLNTWKLLFQKVVGLSLAAKHGRLYQCFTLREKEDVDEMDAA